MSRFANFAIAGATIVMFALPASRARAQGNQTPTGGISGTVTDSTGLPLYHAEISVQGSDLRAYSDLDGRFTFGAVPVGPHVLAVRRLGFRPVTIPVDVAQTLATASVRMIAVVEQLPTVVVHPARTKYSGRLAGYYERLEKKSAGYFVTREEIDHIHPTTLTQVLQTVPGIRLGKGRAGITGMRMRGRNCWPLVWLDGTPMPAGEMDMDAIVPTSIQGIELYLGSTTAPIRYIYNGDTSSCGTVLIWSRGPDTDPVNGPSPRVDLDDLIAHTVVYTANEVERPARLDSTQKVVPAFPPSLFAARVRGLVVAEFVVDATGHVEQSTVGIVSSTSPLFSDAVRMALLDEVYVPAMKDGHPVRQLVQQPFRFDVGG